MSKAEPIPKADSRRKGARPLYRRRALGEASNKLSGLENDPIFWDPAKPESALHEPSSDRKPTNLLERTAIFGQTILRFAKTVPRGVINDPLINQLVRAGTSVGANYSEAYDPVSRKDYLKSIGTCRKVSKETLFWLHMIAAAEACVEE
jgi:four helix bundle protein